MNKLYSTFLDPCGGDLAEPWTDGNNTFYSDGNIIIRVPFDQNVTQTSFRAALPWHRADKSDFAPVAKVKIKHKQCPDCLGRGTSHDCLDCDGIGYATRTVENHDYEDNCEKCEGTGVVNGGEDVCEHCGGDGYIEKIEPVAISENISLSNVMLNKLATLPRCELSLNAIPKTMMVYFQFDGGDGLAMQYGAWC